MSKNTSITLGSHFEEFISAIINSGRYNNVDEVIRDGLRMLEERENKKNALDKALKEGLDSGTIEDFDYEDFLKEMNRK